MKKKGKMIKPSQILNNWLLQNQALYKLAPAYEFLTELTVLETGITATLELSILDTHPIRDVDPYFGGVQFKVRIIKIVDEYLWGTSIKDRISIKDGYEVHIDAPIRFHYSKIIKLSGNFDWELKHKKVLCSKRIITGEKVGYFIDGIYINPLKIDKIFYAVSESELSKDDCEMQLIPLKQLIEIDDSVKPYLNQEIDYGAVRDSKNTFKILTKEYIRFFDRAVYPTFMEDEF